MTAKISARAYAQRRGVDPKTVRQAITEGRCPAQRGAGGAWLIDPAEADAAWRDRTHPGHGGKRERGKISVPGAGLAVDPGQGLAHPAAGAEDDGVLGFLESTKRLQHYKAALAQIKFQIETGELVDKAEWGREIFKTYRAIRDKLLNIPDRVSAILAAEARPDHVRALLVREIERILGPADPAPHETENAPV